VEFRQRRPSPEALAWVERELGRGSRVVAWRRMTGGLTSAVHRLTVQRGPGRLAVVLRQYERSGIHDMAKIIEREAGILSGLPASGLAAPELLAACPAGEAAGGNPAILMTRLPGHLDLSPADPGVWLRQMAAAAAAIHGAAVSAPGFESWFDTAALAVPATATRPALWQAAIGVLQQGAGPAGMRFIHHDFQPFNFLWTRGRLTGVVDWTWASTGAPATDAGHCRLYLAVLSGAGLAEQFRLAYEAEAGRRIDPWWDLHSLAGYNDAWPRFIPLQACGHARVDVAGMTARVEEVLAAALRRL
jgi:aminoglycoside phosphotransferase (APT) family kinase protein